MTRYAKTMSQAVAEVQLRELKMNDPKLLKVFDKLKPRDTVKIKHSSTLERGKDFIEYTVRSKNTLRNGVEKITLARKDSPTSVKRFLYNRDGKITFAVGDMAASIDDIKETLDEAKFQVNYSKDGKLFSKTINAKNEDDAEDKAIKKFKIEDDDIRSVVKEEVELDEMDMKYVLINMQGKVQGYASDEKDAKEMARRTKSTMHKIKKKISDKTLEKMNALARTPKELRDLGIIEEIELDEKYDLYHKTFSDAMQHAYDYAKKKMGITVDPKEIDDKVATGPKKPSEGKTNKYRLKGKGGNLQIQVYNKGGSKPFELNMYKEDLDKEDEPVVKKVVDMLKKASQAHAGQAKDLEKAVKEGKMRVYRVSSRKLQGNIHAKDEKEAEKIARSKGMKGKLTITDRGEFKGQPRLTMGEGTWKYPSNRSEIDALKKLMARPIRLGREGEGAVVAMQGLLGDDELFDDFYLDGSKNENGDARKTIIKWFRNRVKKDTYGLGDETRELGKKIGLKMSFVPEENNMTEKLTDGNLSLKETVLKMWQEASVLNEAKVIVDLENDDPKLIKDIKKFGLKVKDLGDSGNAGYNEYEISGPQSKIDAANKKLNLMPEAKSPEQQAAIAIAKKEKEKKEEPDEGNKFSGELDKARKAGKKTFKVGDKEYKVEPKKEEFSWPEWERYLETKKGSLRESILNIWGELDEGKMKELSMKIDSIVAKMKKDKQMKSFADKFKKEAMKSMDIAKSLEKVLPDYISGGDIEALKKEEKDLTKEQENGKKKMTDTGKEMTPVDLAPKMPKIKNEKNRI